MVATSKTKHSNCKQYAKKDPTSIFENQQEKCNYVEPFTSIDVIEAVQSRLLLVALQQLKIIYLGHSSSPQWFDESVEKLTQPILMLSI